MSTQKLTPMQARFVKLYVHSGNAVQAAIDAGYKPSTAKDHSWELIRKPHLLEAIRIETQAALDAGVAIGKKVLIDLAQNAVSEAVKLQAGLALLDRGGLRLKHLSEHQHTLTVVDQRSDSELRERIKQLSSELGLPVGSLLIEHELARLPALEISDAEIIPADIFT